MGNEVNKQLIFDIKQLITKYEKEMGGLRIKEIHIFWNNHGVDNLLFITSAVKNLSLHPKQF